MDNWKNNTINMKEWRKYKKPIRNISIILFLVIVVLSLSIPAFNWLIDYIWMDSLGYSKVFTTILMSKILLIVIGFLLFFITTFITFKWMRRAYLNQFQAARLPIVISNKKWSNLIIISVSIIMGIIGSGIVQGIGWEPALKLINQQNFGATDPYFNMDVAFYLFTLPFLKFIIYVLLSLAVMFLIVQMTAYLFFDMYKVNKTAQLQLGTTLGIIGLLLAGQHLLAPFETLLTDQVSLFQKSVVHGLSFTDKIINIPKSYILAAIVIIAVIWMIMLIVRGKIEKAILPIAIYVGMLIVGQGASVIVQNFIVVPNEFVRETPFLEHNLKFSRVAYGLNEIVEEEHPGNDSLNDEMVERNSLTLDNVRLNDSRPLLDIYNQLQTFRTYYKFNDMDIDRYVIDGDYEQVFIGARELSTDDLPQQSQTWVNRTLRYTHGYGIAMSHVNKVTGQGQPEYMMRNIPSEGLIDVTRPQIYFGEEPYRNVIVNSKVDEFDYPTGDENATNRFEEKTGITLKGIKRWLFALDEKSFRILFSDRITGESQLLATRNIMDRVKRIAPFFEYDADPYIVIRDDGTLVWIIDAYLSAEGYPYAENYQGDKNYIRNSVKVSIDAYSGEVNYYIVDQDEPLLKTYEKMFPELFTKDIPEDIQAHFRYPEKLFKVQAEMYGTYHMSNLEVFYNREDFWQFPTEKYFDQDIEMEPYYITMKLPEETEEEFILMMPYTPKKRQNMIAWMGVRNDGDNYGDIFVYRFPKQKNIYGPQQIENRINQDSEISKQLNLWSQGGSKVIRGNLLAIPIEDTVLYVEPIYIESSNETSLPEVKQVVMAYGDDIVMEETFDKALNEILSIVDPEHKTDDKDETEKPDDTEKPAEPILDADAQLKHIADRFNDYQEALANGKYKEAGEILEEIEQFLNEMN